MKWEYTDYRPEGFECWEAKWGRFYSIAVAKIGEKRYTVWWYCNGLADLKTHIDAENWNEAKEKAIEYVRNFISKRAKHWKDMELGFIKWTREE